MKGRVRMAPQLPAVLGAVAEDPSRNRLALTPPRLQGVWTAPGFKEPQEPQLAVSEAEGCTERTPLPRFPGDAAGFSCRIQLAFTLLSSFRSLKAT